MSFHFSSDFAAERLGREGVMMRETLKNDGRPGVSKIRIKMLLTAAHTAVHLAW